MDCSFVLLNSLQKFIYHIDMTILVRWFDGSWWLFNWLVYHFYVHIIDNS